LVTHDRYFLDNICTEIIELDNGQLYTYKGNYAYFLEKKAMRETFQEKEADAARKLMRKELEWMRKQPKARTTKSKSRISSFYETKEKASFKNDTSKVEIVMQMNRLGTKILETHQVEKKFGNQSIVKDFTYLFKPGERIGIIGKNGVGKSTFLNMLLGLEKQDGGRIIKGDTVRFGYYSQQGMQISDDKRVIEVITDIAEYLEVGKGQKLTATTLLKMFLFDAKKQYNFVSVLSGGEKRRLYLLTVLMKKPNFLVLDEPTNDLDIDTLNVLEEFLESYEGCLLVVTHDRYFMDTLVDSLFVFEGEGFVRPFNGNYQDYLNEQEEKKQLASQSSVKPANNANIQQSTSTPTVVKTEAKKLSFKEQRELELLDKEMSSMQIRKAALENLLGSGSENTEEIRLWGEELLGIIQSLEEKELRWLELSV
jgi:ATP-binding cassette subfamily F protein uup